MDLYIVKQLGPDELEMFCYICNEIDRIGNNRKKIKLNNLIHGRPFLERAIRDRYPEKNLSFDTRTELFIVEVNFTKT